MHPALGRTAGKGQPAGSPTPASRIPRLRPGSGWRDTEIGPGETDTENGREGQGVHALTPNPAPAVPNCVLPTSSLAVPVTPPALLSPHHSGWATVKRRCRRMLWFTRSFLKSPGEPRGESRGEPGPEAGAGAGAPCISATAWEQDGSRAVEPFCLLYTSDAADEDSPV